MVRALLLVGENLAQQRDAIVSALTLCRWWTPSPMERAQTASSSPWNPWGQLTLRGRPDARQELLMGLTFDKILNSEEDPENLIFYTVS